MGVEDFSKIENRRQKQAEIGNDHRDRADDMSKASVFWITLCEGKQEFDMGLKTEVWTICGIKDKYLYNSNKIPQ
jgi:hypothetical protein